MLRINNIFATLVFRIGKAAVEMQPSFFGGSMKESSQTRFPKKPRLAGKWNLTVVLVSCGALVSGLIGVSAWAVVSTESAKEICTSTNPQRLYVSRRLSEISRGSRSELIFLTLAWPFDPEKGDDQFPSLLAQNVSEIKSITNELGPNPVVPVFSASLGAKLESLKVEYEALQREVNSMQSSQSFIDYAQADLALYKLLLRQAEWLRDHLLFDGPKENPLLELLIKQKQSLKSRLEAKAFPDEVRDNVSNRVKNISNLTTEISKVCTKR